MKSKGLINLNSFNIVIASFSNSPNEEQVDLYFNEMIQSGFTPTVKTLNYILKMHVTLGNIEKAQAVFDSTATYNIVPDSWLYATLMSGYAKVNY